MKEIDTESTVIWPTWCYSGNIPTDILKQTPATATTAFIDIKTETPTTDEFSRTATGSTPIVFKERSDCLTKDFSTTLSNNNYHNADNNVTHKSPSPKVATIATTLTTAAKVTTSATIKRNSKSTNKTLRQQKARLATASKLLNNNYSQNSQQDNRHSATVSPSQEATTLSTPASLSVVVAAAEKMLSERSLLLNRFNTLGGTKKLTPTTTTATTVTTAEDTANSTPTYPNTAAAYLYLEKLKNDKIASSTQLTAAQLDSLKETIMESAAIGNNNGNKNNNNNNNINSLHSNNNNLLISHATNSTNAVSGGANSSITGNQQHQQQQTHCNNSSSSSSNSSSGSGAIKRERLSPGGTNGEMQARLTRSRSTTPSSFRGTSSPQQMLNNSTSDTVISMYNNLSANLLNSLQQSATISSRQYEVNANLVKASASAMPTDFSARNYSDIMRSLAAKYNNSSLNDNTNSRRSLFFDNSGVNTSSNASSSSKLSSSISKASTSNTMLPSSLTIKELPSSTATGIPTLQQQQPPPPSLPTTATLPPPSQPIAVLPPSALSPNFSFNKQQNAQNQIAAAAAEAAVSPFMSSFLCSLPFMQGVFPPLIDMSSTQALLTLARAAKEVELQSILSARNSKQPSSSASSSPRPNISAAIQQAAQFVAPTFIYSAQMQQAQQQQRQQQQQQQQKQAQQQQQQKQQSLTRPASRQLSQPSPRAETSASIEHSSALKTSNIGAAPLDLSSQPPAAKRFKVESTSRRVSSTSLSTSPSPPIFEKNAHSLEDTSSSTKIEATTVTSTKSNLNNTKSRQCQAQSEEVNSWSVDEVCSFVGGIDICAEYVQHFRDQCIDGSGLPLLTEDHLVNSLGMKLGPALKLRSMLAKKLGGPCPCVACVAQTQQILALQAAAATTSTNIPPQAPPLSASATKTTNTSKITKPNINNDETSTEAKNVAAGAETDFLLDEVQQHYQKQHQHQHLLSTANVATSERCDNENNNGNAMQQQEDTKIITATTSPFATSTIPSPTSSSASCNNINNNDCNKANNNDSGNGNGIVIDIGNDSGSGSGSGSSSCNVNPNIGNNSIARNNNNDNSRVGLRRVRSSSSSSHSSHHSDAKCLVSADSVGDGS